MNVEMLEWITGWRNQIFLNYKSVRFIKALTLHKMINIITGSVESAVNHLHPRVGITRSAIQTRNVDPSAQKN